MEVATALAVAMCGIILDMLNDGLGKNLWDIPIHIFFPSFMLKNLIIAMIFCAASALSKISILLMYLRIFTSNNWFRHSVFVAIVFVAGYGIASVLANLFSCSPINGSWDLVASQSAKCMNRPAFYLAQAGLGIVADVVTVLIPIPAISKLRMDLKKKLGVAGLLTMGGFVCVVSMIRLQSLIKLLESPNLTRVTPNALMWCVFELTLSIIAGCGPAIKPFLKRYAPFLVSRTTYSNTKTNGSHRLHDMPLSRSHAEFSGAGKPKPAVNIRSTPSMTAESESVEELVQTTKGYKATRAGAHEPA